jgi:GGDEF domain-containing protein
MRHSRGSAGPDIGLIAACLAVTAIAWWVVASRHGAPGWIHGIVISAYGLTAFVVLRRDAQPRASSPAPPVDPGHPPDHAPALVDGIAAGMARSFLRWLAETPAGQSWPAFDQFVRELLADQLGAGHVRCFHVSADSGRPASLSGAPESAGPSPGSAEVIERVLASGRSYLATADPDARNAHASSFDAAWIIPGKNGPLGLITIGSLPPHVHAHPSLCATIELLMHDFWLHVAARDDLAIARRTDRPTGVLSREAFFHAGRALLADSRTSQEPLVAVIVALEGMRKLDDDRHWGRRDRLVQEVGAALAARLCADDCIGRFADDRFAILLRRADAGLGRLISEKLVAAVDETLSAAPSLADAIRARAGFLSNGTGQIALEDLLGGAFDAVDQARRSAVRVMTELPDREGATV